MKARHRRFVWIGAGVGVLAIAVALVLNAFQSNLVFFFTPTQIAANEVPHGRAFRVGGMSLSNFGEVVIGARLSKSGQAIAQSGDFEGVSPPVKVGSRGVAVVIDKAIP